ncbi:hypothetical protein BC938DRAFT_480146, partial [Jimgerdemannia flammicorona]
CAFSHSRYLDSSEVGTSVASELVEDAWYQGIPREPDTWTIIKRESVVPIYELFEPELKSAVIAVRDWALAYTRISKSSVVTLKNRHTQLYLQWSRQYRTMANEPKAIVVNTFPADSDDQIDVKKWIFVPDKDSEDAYIRYNDVLRVWAMPSLLDNQPNRKGNEQKFLYLQGSIGRRAPVTKSGDEVSLREFTQDDVTAADTWVIERVGDKSDGVNFDDFGVDPGYIRRSDRVRLRLEAANTYYLVLHNASLEKLWVHRNAKDFLASRYAGIQAKTWNEVLLINSATHPCLENEDEWEVDAPEIASDGLYDGFMEALVTSQESIVEVASEDQSSVGQNWDQLDLNWLSKITLGEPSQSDSSGPVLEDDPKSWLSSKPSGKPTTITLGEPGNTDGISSDVGASDRSYSLPERVYPERTLTDRTQPDRSYIDRIRCVPRHAISVSSVTRTSSMISKSKASTSAFSDITSVVSEPPPPGCKNCGGPLPGVNAEESLLCDRCRLYLQLNGKQRPLDKWDRLKSHGFTGGMTDEPEEYGEEEGTGVLEMLAGIDESNVETEFPDAIPQDENTGILNWLRNVNDVSFVDPAENIGLIAWLDSMNIVKPSPDNADEEPSSNADTMFSDALNQQQKLLPDPRKSNFAADAEGRGMALISTLGEDVEQNFDPETLLAIDEEAPKIVMPEKLTFELNDPSLVDEGSSQADNSVFEGDLDPEEDDFDPETLLAIDDEAGKIISPMQLTCDLDDREPTPPPTTTLMPYPRAIHEDSIQEESIRGRARGNPRPLRSWSALDE